MNRLEFFRTRKGKAHLYQKRTGSRFSFIIKNIEPQSKKMKAAEQDILQEQIVKALNEQGQQAYCGPIALQVDLATTGRTAPQAQTIAKNFLDLFSTRRPKVSGRRSKLLYRDDRQIQALSVSCRHGQSHPYIAVHSQRFSDALKDLELAAEAAGSSDLDWHREWEEETDNDSIQSFRDLLQDPQHGRSKLGDDTYEALLKMTRWQAQRALLNRSRVTTQQLARPIHDAGGGGGPISL